MSEVRANQFQETFGAQLVLAGIMATNLHGQAVPNQRMLVEERPAMARAYVIGGHSSTVTSDAVRHAEIRDIAPKEFEQAVGSFYASLVNSQEDLGEVFEKVLYQNLSDLYES